MVTHKHLRRAPRWFDRINRYRIAAGFLFVPFVLALVALATGVDIDVLLPRIARRGIYWIGLLLLTISLALDAWEVYRGKREVKKLIVQRVKQDD